uniref:Uncharacterized protein n=1 Tax=uncultured prokaryote TaxID=198431 RepID=A0A0H5Q249_9ZZZZ|nr:hypothetical protein [uncultured prokaryote]
MAKMNADLRMSFYRSPITGKWSVVLTGPGVGSFAVTKPLLWDAPIDRAAARLLLDSVIHEVDSWLPF